MTASPLDDATRRTAATLITFYQKRISPHKGFSCAHRVLHGGESCSQYTKRSILENGLRQAVPLIKQRFRDCKTANQTLRRQVRMRSWLAIEGGPEIPEGDLPDPLEPGQPGAAGSPNQGVKQAGSSGSDCGGNSCSSNDCATSLDCFDVSCDTLDCATTDWSMPDCSGLDCSGVDCSGADCSSLDCGGADCGSCDFGSCG